MFDINKTPYKSVSRQIVGAIRYINNETEYEINPEGQLIKYTIERTAPNGKLFGFIVSQLIRIEVAGVLGNIQKGDKLIPTIGVKNGELVELPNFYVSEVIYDKVNNITKIVGNDILDKGKDIPINKLSFVYPIMLQTYAAALTTELGAALVYEGLDYEIATQPNINGYETLKSILGAIAEASGSICYVSKGDVIKFRKLSAVPVDTLTPANYFELTTGASTTLTRIASATELGDNVSYGDEGYTQAFWNNPFFDMLESDALITLLETIGNEVIGLSGADYDIKWRGCPAYEIGDYITIQEKDNNNKNVYYFDEVLVYDGGLSSQSDWKAGEGENTSTNPTSLGAVLSQTSAKVDKVNKEINLVITEVGNHAEDISSLKLDTQSINASVQSTQKSTESAIEGINSDIETLTKRVDSTITSEAVEIQIQNALVKGTTEITTTTGFTFNEEGLTVAKSGSEMTTQITEDGMIVSKNNTAMLTANNEGIEAVNLFASTFLVVGRNSRFEDFDTIRTGCFWIGN